MSDIFEKLQKIAREEFGCELARVQEKSSFEELFGISHQEIEMLSEDGNCNVGQCMYSSEMVPVMEEDAPVFDAETLAGMALAA